jgi:hypothetical protein
MPIEPNIALGIRPIEQPNMLGQMAQAMALRQAQQEYEGSEGVNELARQGIKDPNAYLPYGKQGRATYESILKGQKDLREGQKLEVDLGITKIGAFRDQLMANVNDPAAAARWLTAVNGDPLVGKVLSSVPLADQIAAIPSDPKGFADWKNRTALKAPDFVKHFVESADAQLSSRTSLATNAATVAVQRDRLNADSTPLAIDDKTIDLVANRYLIDGTLPPLGMGKPAAMLRAKILDRAQAIATQSPAATPPPNTTPSVSVSPQTEIPAPDAAPVVNNLNPAPTAATPNVNNLVAPPVGTPPVVAPVGTTPQQAAQNIVTSKTNTATQRRALTDFSTGIQGRMVNSMNTAVEHLSTLTELADALKNNDVRAINTVGNLVAKQTGSPAPTNFAAARQIVAQEIVKAIVANGGTGREREEAAANIAAAGSPEQLAGVISTYQELLAGQLKSLGLQYKNTTGRDDFNTKLLPSTIRALDRSNRGTTAAAGTGAPGRTVIRTGTFNGKKVTEYSDGSIE